MIGVYALLNSRNQSQALAEILRQRRRNAELIEELKHENTVAHQARQAAEQANRSKAQLFAAANHDLRQPLHAVTLLAQTLQRETEPEAIHATAARIGQCVDNLSQLVDAMLELSQLDAGAVVPQPVHFAIRNLLADVARTYEPLARAKGLAFSIPDTAEIVHGDPRLLARVISNLVANAVRYTERGHAEIRISDQPGESAVRVHVSDTGIGIAESELPRIFEEFYQVANRARDRRLGLGLGLATVRRLADRLALDLRVQSELGRGSDFSVVLPRGDGTLIAPSASESAEGHLRDRRVLLVEDDADSRVALAGLLRQWHCQVRATAQEQEALDWVAAGYRPELVIADYRLDGQRSGAQVIHAIRVRLGDSLPALLVTGEALEGVVGKPDDVPLLRKPVRPMPLRALLNKTFADRS